MNDYGYYTKPGSFKWDCPHCKKTITCYTEKALSLMREQHLEMNHKDQQPDAERTEAVNKFRHKNPDKLNVTLIDIGFLKTRGVKLDEDIVLDFSITEMPTKSEGLSLREWSGILERVLWRKLGTGN